VPDTSVLDHPFLGVERFFIIRFAYLLITAIWQHHSGLDVVFQMHKQDLIPNRVPDRLIIDREKGLDAVIKVARHQVCASQQDLFLAPIPKIINPGML
jgi:hypothetical protein